MQPENSNYSFVVAFDYLDIYDVFFDELKTLPYAMFVPHQCREQRGLRRIIEKFLYSKKTRFFFPNYARKLWLRNKIKRYQNTFSDKDKPLCFVLPQSFFRYKGYGIVEAIREVSPRAKVVYFFTDLVSRTEERKRCALSVGEADLKYSFDDTDAKVYGLRYHAVPYSDVSYLADGIACEHDICFVGHAKNRLQRILNVYRSLTARGVDCDFYIIGAAEEDRQFADKIHYCEPFSYLECLRITARSRCILEVTQANSSGHTARVPEAILFGKRLLSDNPALAKDAYFDSEHMRIFSSADEIDVAFVQNPEAPVYTIDKQTLLPSRFLRHIEEELDAAET